MQPISYVIMITIHRNRLTRTLSTCGKTLYYHARLLYHTPNNNTSNTNRLQVEESGEGEAALGSGQEKESVCVLDCKICEN